MDPANANEALSLAGWTARLETAIRTRRDAGPAAALPLLKSLTREAPDRAAGWIETAACLRDLQRFEQAEAMLGGWLQKTPSDGRALHDLARLLERHGAWADAEALWRRMLALPNPAWWVHANLATALQRQARLAEAEEVLSAAVDRHPAEAALFCDYARLAEARDNWAAARTRWEVAQDRFPAQSAPRLGLAGVLRHDGDLAGAERLLRAAAEADPDDFKTQHDLARTLEQRKDWAGAEQIWRRLRALDQAPWGVHSALAGTLLRQGRRHDAEEALAFGIALPTRKLPLLIEYAKLAEQRADWNNAAARWNLACEHFADRPDGYLGQSGALRKTGDVAGAAAIMAEAMRRFATQPDIVRESAAVKLQQGDWEGAASALDEVARRNPNDAVAAHRAYEARRIIAGNPVFQEISDRSASVPSLGHRIMAPGPLGGEIVPMTLFDHTAQPHIRRAKDLTEFSSSHTLARTFLDAADGQHERARRRIADTIDVNEHRYPDDAGTFSDLFVAAVASCSWDGATRMLQDRYRSDWCAGVGAARDSMKAQCIRWTIGEDGRSRFEVDRDYYGGVPAWMERLPSCLDMLFEYTRLTEKAAGGVVLTLGDHGLLPGLAFSDFRPDVFLVPDSQFMNSRGYAERRSYYDRSDVPWDQRKAIALWRGSAMRTSGEDLRPIQGEPLDVPRVKLCVIGREPGAAHLMDVGLAGNHHFPAQHYKEFEQQGLTAGFVNQRQFNQFKYQIDVDGISNSWALFVKLLTGSAVLKVQSPTGFKQWYYDDLKPWVHYVPVVADLSDLVDRIRWLQDHDDEAREIGRNGRALVQAMTYETELERAMTPIGAAFRYFNG